MAARSKARKRALDVLYESDVRAIDPLTALAERVGAALVGLEEDVDRALAGLAAGGHRGQLPVTRPR